MIQISKILNAPYGLCIHFQDWPQITSRGFQRPNTSFLLKLKKMQLKNLPPSGCQINYYFIISTLFCKFKIQSDSVGWQCRRAVHKLQKTTPTGSYCFCKIVELYNFMYQIKLLLIWHHLVHNFLDKTFLNMVEMLYLASHSLQMTFEVKHLQPCTGCTLEVRGLKICTNCYCYTILM